MNPLEKIIKVCDLTMAYGSRTIMEDLNFSINKGEIFIILGGSGCGKSTLLKHLIGLYEPHKGEILIRDKSIVTADVEEKQQIMKSFGVLYQSGALFGSLTLAENILVVLEHTDLTDAEKSKVVEEKLEIVELKGYEEFYPSEISGGMKKRAGLARAMALNPDLLFFDEPSAGLDPISSANLDKTILKLKNELGTTMVIVTHELDSIYSIADKVLFLDKETKTMCDLGHPEELRKNSKNDFVRRFLNRDGMLRQEN
ncbi:MAG: ATP-binding cassette domain-containing protein [Lentisphaeraceae bacterium]|nr:ATP-binding cassette domain-containing protein [Lentisphaeraceae bacterium]